jgi:hypothetical protein
MRNTIVIGVWCLLCVIGWTAEVGEAGVDRLAWLAGRWVSESDTSTVEEMWLAPAGGSMVGVNRTVSDGATVAFEFLRIARHGETVVYLASPGGRYPPTSFELIEIDTRRAVFANPDHDFPQRITYVRDGDRLTATIAGRDHGREQTISWEYRLAG